jgi:spore germination cell wall hydrolase CwlJ-like protein
MSRFSLVTLCFLLLPSLAQARDCSETTRQNLLANALYREAITSQRAQAAVAAIVFNRVASGRYGNTICSVITWRPKQFEYRLPRHVSRTRLTLARQSAEIFLREREGGGWFFSSRTQGDVFAQLKGYDSFYACGSSARHRARHQGNVLNFGDNCFYKSHHGHPSRPQHPHRRPHRHR